MVAGRRNSIIYLYDWGFGAVYQINRVLPENNSAQKCLLCLGKIQKGLK